MGNSIQNYNAGELVLIGPNLPHCWKNNSQQYTVAKSVVIQFKKDFLGEGWLDKNEFTDIKKLLHSSRYGLIFSKNTSLRIGEKMEAMKQFSPMLKLIEFIRILHDLSSETYEILSLGTLFDSNVLVSKRIEKIMVFIEQNYHVKIGAKELSEITFLSPVSFSKFFKKTFNKTFTAYLNEYRISKSCELLKETELSVEQIAFETGYQNLSFFHRQFKLYTQKTPAQFRVLRH